MKRILILLALVFPFYSCLFWSVSDQRVLSRILITELEQPLSGEVNSITISGDFAYAALGQQGMHILDVSDPFSPQTVGKFFDLDSGESVKDISLSAGYAYLAGGDRLRILDVADPSLPRVPSGGTQGVCLEAASKVEISGQYAYVFDSLRFKTIDISTPDTPNLAASIVLSGSNPLDLSIAGNYAYLTCQSSFLLRIVDLSDPVSPQEVGILESDLFISDESSLCVAGGFVFKPITENELYKIDVSDPTSSYIADILFVENQGEIMDVAVSGNYAYILTFLTAINNNRAKSELYILFIPD